MEGSVSAYHLPHYPGPHLVCFKFAHRQDRRRGRWIDVWIGKVLQQAFDLLFTDFMTLKS